MHINIINPKKNTLLRVIPTMTCWVKVVRWGLLSSSRSKVIWEWIQDSIWCQFVEELRFVSASRPPPRLRQQHQQLLTKFHFHNHAYNTSPSIQRPSLEHAKAKSKCHTLRSPGFHLVVRLLGSGEGKHSTHLLKCVLLLWTSQIDWKQSSDVFANISFDILSDISSDISSGILSDISFDISFDISSDILSDIFLTYLLTFFLTYLLTFFLTYLFDIFLTYLFTFFLTYQNQNLTSTASQKKQLCKLYIYLRPRSKSNIHDNFVPVKYHRPQCIKPPRQKAVKSKDAKHL